MLKGITRSIKTRKNYYNDLEETEEKINKAMRVYLTSIFSNYLDCGDVECSFNTKDHILTVVAPSKTIANEIKLSLVELAVTLKGEGLEIKTIIVR
jgi:hypothetical protein